MAHYVLLSIRKGIVSQLTLPNAPMREFPCYCSLIGRMTRPFQVLYDLENQNLKCPRQHMFINLV